MAIFGSSNTTEKKSGATDTFITDCITISGNINGCGTVYIDGTVDGNVDAGEAVIIGRTGKVKGNIKSKKVVVSGLVDGEVETETIEVTKTGSVTHTIKSEKSVLDGKIEGSIDAVQSVHVGPNGTVMAKSLKTKKVVVEGEIDGDIVATEILEILKSGKVKGQMKIQKIKVEEGGLMLGNMSTYQAPQAETPKK